jgi:hypothetical protein
MTTTDRLPLESCICGTCFDCPDGWHWHDDDQPCGCTADCALEAEPEPTVDEHRALLA